MCCCLFLQEIAEPLMDLKKGIEELLINKTFKYILSAILTIGNFLNGAQVSSINLLTLLNPFPHTTILQQTTLNIFCQKIENLYNWMDNLWLKVENIAAKGEIACFEQYFLLSLVCCRGVGKRLYYMRERVN